MESFRTAPLFNIMTNLKRSSRLRDQSATKRELSEHADIHDRRGTRLWPYGGPVHHLSALFLSSRSHLSGRIVRMFD